MFSSRSSHDKISEVNSNDFCFEKLEKLLSESVPKVETARDKEVVLVIGNSGSGKSTTTNYLMGCHMKESVIEGKFVIETENKAYAKIGHSLTSETLYPEVYTNFDDLSYCDCPGFGDTRGKEEQICISMTTQLAVKFSKMVKAVMIVIDYNEMTTGRGEGFKKLSNILGQLFKEPDKLSDSILFVVTKAQSRITKNHFIEIVSSLIKTEELYNEASVNWFKKILSLGKTPSNEEHQKVENFANKMKILQLMKDHCQNIEVIDVLDQGAMRTTIIKRLRDMRPISLEAFDFQRYDDARVKFDRVIFKIAHEGAKSIQNKVDLPGHIRDCEYKINDAEERIQFYRKQIERIRNPAESTEENQKTGLNQIEVLQKRCENNIELIKNDREKQILLEQEISDLRKNLAQLDSDKLVLYWAEEFKRTQSWLSWLRSCYFGYRGTFNYSDVPFEKVETYKSSGNLKVIKDSPIEGKYIAEYDSASEFFRNFTEEAKPENEDTKDQNENELHKNNDETEPKKDIWASVKIYVQTRNKPDIKKRIQDIIILLKKKKNKKNGIKSNINKLNEENKLHNDMISNLESTVKQNEKQLKKRIQNFEMGICEFSEKIKLLRNDKDASQQRWLQSEHEVSVNYKLFEMVKKMSTVIDFSSPLIKEFLHQLDRLCHQKSIESKLSKEVPAEFICPIKHDIMDDPVIFECSHTFEILNFLSMKMSNVIECPPCREHINKNNLINNAQLKLAIETWKEESGKKIDIFDQVNERQKESFDSFSRLECNKIFLEEKIESLKLKLAQYEIEYKNLLVDYKKVKPQLV